MDLAKEVTTKEMYQWLQGSWTLEGDLPAAKQPEDLPFHVVAYDYGVKRNILRMLVDRGCRLTVVPAQTPAEDVLKLNQMASSYPMVLGIRTMRLRDHGHQTLPGNGYSGVRHLSGPPIAGAGQWR